MKNRTRTAAVAAVVLTLALPAFTSGAGAASGPRGAGTEGRQWVAGPATPPVVSKSSYRIKTISNATMLARDATKLSLNLYLPDAPGRFPCLLIQEGYGKNGSIGSVSLAQDFARRGYGVVQADVRGQGASAGRWEPFTTKEGQDGYDLVEWTAAQPWCTGKVGTFGTSYMAITQMLTAKQAPPHLVAMIPVQSWGDAYDGWFWKGGVMSLEDPLVYEGLEEGLQKTPPGDNDTSAFGDHLLNRSIAQYQREYMQHPTRDGFWHERSTWPEDMAAIAHRGVKVMFQDGWNDFFLKPELDMYRQFVDAGGTGKLVVGPWTHGGEAGVLPYDFQTFRVLWFDRWLKGVSNGIDRGPRALLYVQGAESWRWETDFPVRDAAVTRFYLRAAKAGGASSLNDGSLSLTRPAATEAPASYPYTPAQVGGGGGLIGGAQSPQDQRIDETRSLTWATPPLARNSEVTGPVSLSFWASSTATDTDFVARLVDVAPDGTAKQINRGWLKATHHQSDAHPTPLVPGTVYRFTVKIWPTSQVFAAGHRIRVDLSGADVPLMMPNSNPATNTVLQDAAHPSYLELPLVGRLPSFSP